MANTTNQPPQPRTVQDYIDERPMWPDGTHLHAFPMTTMQKRIWMLAAAGKFFEGFVVFMTGVALPLIARQFNIGAAQHGFVTAATLGGILIGAVGLGSLSDYFGRKSMFIVEMIIFTAFLGAAVFCTSFVSLVFCLFGLGLALGCDYPTAHMIISESIPSTSRGRLVLAAFAFQAVGALGGAVVGYAVLVAVPNLNAWRWMFATAVVPALVVTIGRFYVTESANWLHTRGATDRAKLPPANSSTASRNIRQTLCLFRNSHPPIQESTHNGGSFLSLFNKRYRRATILASVPWFLQDLSTYGIGIFTPTILAAAIGHKAEHVRSMSDLISNATLAARGDAMITMLLIIGIAFAVVLADKVGRIKLQIFGFIGCAVGLFLASLSVDFSGGTENHPDLCRLHALRLYDQPRSERANLSACRRGLPDRDPWQGRRVCGSVCQDRRGGNSVPVSHPAGDDRHAMAALWPDCLIAAWSCRHLDVSDRDHGVNLDHIGEVANESENSKAIA